MSELRDELESAIGKTWTKRLVVVASIIFIWLMVSLIFSFWPFSAAAKVVTTVTSAENIIYNYQWFYDQKGVIDSTRNKWKIAKRSSASEADGILMVLETMIADYNARSKQITRNLWKADGLPYQIESEVSE